MDDGGRNVTPDKIKRDDAQKLNEVCDEHLRRIIDAIKPEFLVGVGAFAEECLERVTTGESGFQISRILHPSPASPAANRDWEGTVMRQLAESGVWSE
jgi:single-strand selective monofunctional uracil DNA glycosylase